MEYMSGNYQGIRAMYVYIDHTRGYAGDERNVPTATFRPSLNRTVGTRKCSLRFITNACPRSDPFDHQNVNVRETRCIACEMVGGRDTFVKADPFTGRDLLSLTYIGLPWTYPDHKLKRNSGTQREMLQCLLCM